MGKLINDGITYELGAMYDENGVTNSIKGSSFWASGGLSYFESDQVLSIGYRSFYYCYNLKEIYLQNCTSIGKEAFYLCNNIQTLNIPNCTKIDDYACRQLAKLSNLNATNIYELSISAFQECTSLKNLNFPKISKLGSSCFHGCSNLESVVLGSVGNPVSIISDVDWTYGFYPGSFMNCPKLKDIYVYTNGGIPIVGEPWGATYSGYSGYGATATPISNGGVCTVHWLQA